MTEALGSAGFSFTGVADVRVGNAVTCVSSWTRCCAEVALADWPTQKRRNSRFTLGAAAGLTKMRVVAPATVTPAEEIENSRIVLSNKKGPAKAGPVSALPKGGEG
jgi:hypothetical protein